MIDRITATEAAREAVAALRDASGGHLMFVQSAIRRASPSAPVSGS
jgi:hypothetical protein